MISLEQKFIYDIIDKMDVEEISYSSFKFDNSHKNVAIELSLNDFNILIFKNLDND